MSNEHLAGKPFVPRRAFSLNPKMLEDQNLEGDEENTPVNHVDGLKEQDDLQKEKVKEKVIPFLPL